MIKSILKAFTSYIVDDNIKYTAGTLEKQKIKVLSLKADPLKE
jgi:hypothetical protein